jgi:hypothetical protein
VNPVAIVGNVANAQPPYLDQNLDIWAFNAGAMHRERISAVFQMHEPEGYECNGIEYLNWLSALTIPVYMRQQRPEFPASIAYPFDRAFSMTEHIQQGAGGLQPLKFFTSSVAYAIALAIIQERPRIDVYGVELMGKKEYRDQRECFAFWVGFAGGLGIPVNIYCAGSIFRQPLYGG